MNDLVSVIITTYLRTDTLKRAIQSVLTQTYHNIEVIVVDDNEKEEIRQEVMKIVSLISDSRVKLVLNATNMGGALARNEGIKASKGRYIAFLDDDDEYLPQKIEKQLNRFEMCENNNLALVYCYCIQMKGNQIVRKYSNDYIGKCVYNAMLDCIAATSQWMCRKDALISVGMFTDTPCKQDSYLLLKLLVNGYEIDRVPEFLSIYHTDSINRISNSSGHKKRIVGEEKLRQLCRDHYDMLSDKEKEEVEYSASCRLAEHYFGINDKASFRMEMKNIIRHPFRWESMRVLKHLLLL